MGPGAWSLVAFVGAVAVLLLGGTHAEAVWTNYVQNGDIAIGIGDAYGAMVHTDGNPAFPPSLGGSSYVGLRYIPGGVGGGYEGIAGLHDFRVNSGQYAVPGGGGGCFQDASIPGHLQCPSGHYGSGGSEACCYPGDSVDWYMSGGQMDSLHELAPHPHPDLNENVYVLNVTMMNPADGDPRTKVFYRRAVEWHTEPWVGFSAVQGVVPPPAGVTFSDTVPEDLAAAAAGPCMGTLNTYFNATNQPCGFHVDIDLGSFAVGESKSFCFVYGAHSNLKNAEEILNRLDVEIYSIASSSPTGDAPTFFVGLGCLTDPVADFTWVGPVCASAPKYSVGTAAVFTDLSHSSGINKSSPMTSEWEFGDGATASTSWGAPVSHMYADPGTYPVNLTITDAQFQSRTVSKDLTVVDCSPPNQAPSLLSMGCRTTSVGRAVRVPVIATDPDWSPKHEDYYVLDLVAVDAPPGAFFPPVDGWREALQYFRWRPEEAGHYEIVFQVTDRHAYEPLSATGTLCIDVKPQPVLSPAPENSDADGDGVPDGHDPCPATAAAAGCPAPPDTVDDAPQGDAPKDPKRDCSIMELLPREVAAQWEEPGAVVTWRAPEACQVDRFLVWNGTQGDLIASVPFDPGTDVYEAVDADPWPVPHRYYVQAEPVPGPDVFVYPRAVPTEVVGLHACLDCDAGTPPGPASDDVPPIGGISSIFVGGAPPLLLPWLPVLLLLLAAWWFWHSYGALVRVFSRLDERKVLEHPVRAQLHGLVEDDPGIYVREIVRRSGRSRSVVRHHLRMLVAANALREQRDDGHRRYFPATEAPDPGPVHRALAQRVLASVQESPGRNVSEIAATLGVSRKAVRYHLKRFQAEGVLHVEHTRRGAVVRIAGRATEP